MTKLLIFDYDNTIAQRNSPLSQEMIPLLSELLKNNYIAILTGGRTYDQLKNWIVDKISRSNNTDHLLLCLEYGNIIYQKNPYWKQIFHASTFNSLYKREILEVWKHIDKKQYGLERHCGSQKTNKDTILSLDCLGKNISNDIKNTWDSNMKKRIDICKYFGQKLSFDINIHITGRKTIDFIEIGKDKSSNIKRLSKLTNIDMNSVEYFGDEFTKYGNDYPILDLGIKVHKVKNPKETLLILQSYL